MYMHTDKHWRHNHEMPASVFSLKCSWIDPCWRTHVIYDKLSFLSVYRQISFYSALNTHNLKQWSQTPGPRATSSPQISQTRPSTLYCIFTGLTFFSKFLLNWKSIPDVAPLWNGSERSGPHIIEIETLDLKRHRFNEFDLRNQMLNMLSECMFSTIFIYT